MLDICPYHNQKCTNASKYKETLKGKQLKEFEGLSTKEVEFFYVMVRCEKCRKSCEKRDHKTLLRINKIIMDNLG